MSVSLLIPACDLYMCVCVCVCVCVGGWVGGWVGVCVGVWVCYPIRVVVVENNINASDLSKLVSLLHKSIQKGPSGTLTIDLFRLSRKPIYRFGCRNSGAQKALVKFSFFSCISTKNMFNWRSLISQCM